MLTPETVLQGRYRIVRQLGQGGMGAVYEAVDQRLDTTIALKETLFADERLRKQFEREARLLARLHHPALPRVSDHFSEADGQFLVMQFIPGDDLSEMMTRKRSPFPANQVLTWADQLLDALDYLHTQDPQIVHRDIKPQNLKLTSRGQIILLDFGLAKGQAGEISRVTTTASIFGYTPNYAPLEQIQGLGTDSRSDLYALGATLYHLLTNVKPPDALTRAAAIVNGQADPLIKASEVNTAIAPEVDHVLAKAMAQNREQRYATAADMRKALHGADQASTVVERGEAQTVLFPQPPTTIAVPTQTVATPKTVAANGETTVVRRQRGGPRLVFPIAISAAVLVLVACGALGFYALKNRSDSASQVAAETPTPSGGLTNVPSPSPEATASAEARADVEVAPTAPKKTEKTPRNEEPKKEPAPKPETNAATEEQGHEEQRPDVPVPPEFEGPNRPRRQGTRVFPGGVVIRNFPDGSQIITMPDGMRVMVTKDGKRTVLNPPRPRRRATTVPAPAPTP
ncbi:MAG TPA: protein kinase [Pyrinomonadaceae bacterium]|jgi:serine/threonine protein kinase|nr:protein kinase [Pyrinomonadaceae bacterium]